ncbi:MAG: hypothetical protein QF842_03725 [Candidatus Marinimicrobia bacterium]|jgi:hypothetical protein|nr:hypothetical protein [Candidatus Neomarinimicrobiota bacterium]|tara:strand:+ start:8858 stop:9766 length:909 start_codon:yes stop_codon:yes gene_type:complete
MKKFILITLLASSFAASQGDIYPTEATYGGGIGFSTMYMVLDTVPGAHILSELGLDVNNLSYRPLVFHGGEGFAQMSGPWRLGGYAGLGATQVSNVFDIYLYADRDSIAGYKEPNFGTGTKGDTLYSFSDNLSVKARLNFLMGAVTVEYVFPVYRDLEVMAGALMGVGRYTLSIDQHIGTPKWGDFGNNMFGYVMGDSVMVELDTLGRTYTEAANSYRENGLRPIYVSGAMTELSGTFFNFQPYIAVKWQFLDRMGLRISAGYNKGTIGSGKWKLNGHIPINDSPESALRGITVRTVIYFGL